MPRRRNLKPVVVDARDHIEHRVHFVERGVGEARGCGGWGASKTDTLKQAYGLAGGTGERPIPPALVNSLLRSLDLFVIGALGLAIYIIYVIRVYPDHGYINPRYFVSISLAALLTAIVADRTGAYGSDLVMTRHLRTDRILAAWAITFALLLVISFALKITTFYSRVWALSWFVCTMSLLALGRLLLGRWIAHLAARGRFANRAVIVGIGAQAERLASHLERYDQVRTRILGLVDDSDSPPDHSRHWPHLGGIDTLIELIRAGSIDQVFVALSWQEDERLRVVVQRLAVTPITIRLAPDLAAFTYAGRSLVQIAGLPMLHIFDRPISGCSWLLKATSDYALATLFLIVLSPLMLLTALAIKLDSRGPVLFRQRRVGFNNTPINVWKFRTMHATRADLVGPLILVTRDDPRVTRVGRFLRRLSLDELPQLFNVLRGEMSIVGPRPHPLGARACDQLYEEAVERYAARHRVKPGITGWAQVNGWRGETDTLEKIQKRIEHDLHYIDNWSIWFDLRIIARTIANLLVDDRAY